MARIIVESFSAVEAARDAGYGAKDTWLTTSPFVFEKLGDLSHDVRWLDDSPDGRHTHQAGHDALAAVDAIAGHLLKAEREMAWPRLRIVTAMRVHPLMCAFAYKAKLLEAFLLDGTEEKVIVGSTDVTHANSPNLGVGRYDNLFAILASRMDGHDARIIEHRADGGNLAGMSDRPSLLTRLVSLFTLKPTLLLWRAWILLGYPTIGFSGKGRNVILDGDNESVREMFPVLLRKGCRISFLRKNPLYKSRFTPGTPPAAASVEDLSAAMEQSLRASGIGEAARPSAQIAATLIVEFLAYLASVGQAGKALYKDTVETPRNTLLLAGNAGTLMSHAMGAQLVADGGRTALAQHGASAGMSRYHGYFKHISEARSADCYLVNAPAAVDFYNNADLPNGWSEQPNTTLAIGLPVETAHVPARPFQRFLVRNWLGAKRGERVTMAVIGTYQNNMLYQPGMPNDRTVHDCYMTLARDILPRVSGLPVLKLYSTYRFTDPDPLEGLRRPPAPVVTLKDGDFRFLRAAADIIILDSPLSTIGWAFGAGCPLIYLCYPGFTLTDDTREALEKALFFFDTAQPDWPAKVHDILALPPESLKARWSEMRTGRDRFLARFIAPAKTPAGSAAGMLNTIFSRPQ